MLSRRTTLLSMLSMLSTGTLALGSSRSASAADGCTVLEECLPEIERVFDEEMNGDALAAYLCEAADDGDPPEQGGEASEGEAADDQPKLRSGQAGDVLKAIAADATVKKHLDSFKDKAVEKVKADWGKLETGEQIAAIAFAAPVAGGLVATILKTPLLHRPAQDLVNGAINAALESKVPWLKLSVDLVSPAKVMVLQVDVMVLLRKAGVGF